MLQARPDSVVSHWSTLIEGLQASPLDFYKSVEAALEKRQIPQTKNERIDYRESGLLSARREYLRVGRDKQALDICGAPFGTGFFVSWWLAEPEIELNPILKVFVMLGILAIAGQMLAGFGLAVGMLLIVGVLFSFLGVASLQANEGTFDDRYVLALPGIGWLYVRLFRPATYYRIDSMLMFQKAVHNAVLEVIDQMTTSNGSRMLSESDRKPIMREFYQRRAG